jgi:hypothetical protein
MTPFTLVDMCQSAVHYTMLSTKVYDVTPQLNIKLLFLYDQPHFTYHLAAPPRHQEYGYVKPL